MNTQSSENPDKRQAVLDAMLHLVVANGFHGTPMSLVAKEAGVAAGTIYHYFDGKEAVINELYAILKQQMGQALLQGAQVDKQFRERFFAFWRNLYDFFVQNPKAFAFLELYANSPYISQLAKEENLKSYLPVIDFLAQGIQVGVLRQMDIRLMVALAHGSVATTARLHLSGDMAVTEADLQQAIQSCWDGFRIN
jgi:AcrR family transcriptional regulator